MQVYKNPAKDKWAKLCKRPSLEKTGLDKDVLAVFKQVEMEGDVALLRLTEVFDAVSMKDIVVDQKKVTVQANKTPLKLRLAIDQAYENIAKFHNSQILKEQVVETMPGVLCWRESRPIEKVGLYVPGGTAPLISTVLMLGVPAQIAGCKEVVVCSPPNKDGQLEPGICYAAQKVSATKVVVVGGAQAIAALTFGTKSVPKVDKIFGPGNQYVTAAKQFAVNYGVAIDMPAGPSEVLVVADETSNPAFVAADLLSQAEHGTDSQVVLVTTKQSISTDVQKELAVQLEKLPRKEIAKGCLRNSFCIILADTDKAVEFANKYAPEHIILSVKKPKYVAKQVITAGSVFLGNYSPESAGDYASGTNHTLPTNGWARSYGGVSLDSFVKKVTFQSLTKSGLQKLASSIEVLAKAEGLEAHAWAVRIRLSKK